MTRLTRRQWLTGTAVAATAAVTPRGAVPLPVPAAVANIRNSIALHYFYLQASDALAMVSGHGQYRARGVRPRRGFPHILVAGVDVPATSLIVDAVQRTWPEAPFVSVDTDVLCDDALHLALRDAARGFLLLDDIDRVPVALQRRLCTLLDAGADVWLIGTLRLPLDGEPVWDPLQAVLPRLRQLTVVVPPLAAPGADVLQLFERYVQRLYGLRAWSQCTWMRENPERIGRSYWPTHLGELAHIVDRTVGRNLAVTASAAPRGSSRESGPSPPG